MPDPNIRRLTLVGNDAMGDPGLTNTDRGSSLTRRLEDILRDHQRRSSADGSTSSAHPSAGAPPEDLIPFCIRITMEELLDLADDIELRAKMLQWPTKQNANEGGAALKADCLRGVAASLRQITLTLEDHRNEPD